MGMILEAHQGVANEYPGNTLAAFRAAKALGYGMIELDTKFTADNRCVILHDRTVNRTARHADGTALETETGVDTLTLDEVRRLDAGIYMGERFRGEKIPMLEEVLDFAGEAGIPLKFDNVLWSHTPEQRKLLFSAAETSDAVCGFTCFTTDQVKMLLDIMPGAVVHFDGPVNRDELSALSVLVDPARLYIWMRFDNAVTAWNKTPPCDARSAAAVKKIGKLGVWLLTNEEELLRAAELGADVVETDGQLRPRL